MIYLPEYVRIFLLSSFLTILVLAIVLESTRKK